MARPILPPNSHLPKMVTHPQHLQIHRPTSTTTEFIITTSPPPSLLAHAFTATRLLLLALTLSLTILHPLSTIYRLPLGLAAFYILLQRVTTQEKLLVVKELGIQTSTTAGTLWGQRAKTRFIPAKEVMGVWINEGFVGFAVKFYLCIAVRGEAGVVVVFPVSGDK